MVTGGNSGIGFETVKGLCKRGIHVIMGTFVLIFMEIFLLYKIIANFVVVVVIYIYIDFSCFG